MQPIHVEPDALRNLSRLMERQVHYLLDEEFRLKLAAARIEMAWTGDCAVEYIEELRISQKHLHELTAELYLLAIKLAQHSERWEESDLIWQAAFRDLFNSLPRMGDDL